MAFETEPDFARQVADLNKYGQALNQCESVAEVVSLTIEAMTLLFETPYATVSEVRDEDLEMVHTTNPHIGADNGPDAVSLDAYETGETVVATGDEARAGPDSDAVGAVAVPARIVDDVAAVLAMRSTSTEFDDAAVRPLEILASHAATAIGNIRSRERLERARQDLETRKEMVEMYDRLLRHDIGNDLQVIAGYSEVLADEVDDDDHADYAERIRRAAHSSADLIDRVGTLVSTLEEQDEPEPRDLRAILERSVRDVGSGYDDLTVEFVPEEVEYSVFAGDLLDSVFTNVLSNAAVHNEGEVTVEVYAEAGHEEVVVGIADDGSGIAPEVRNDLFEMGTRGPDSSGTGFGLGFVRALTESYGGGVTVRESESGGADFRVRLERA